MLYGDVKGRLNPKSRLPHLKDKKRFPSQSKLARSEFGVKPWNFIEDLSGDCHICSDNPARLGGINLLRRCEQGSVMWRHPILTNLFGQLNAPRNRISLFVQNRTYHSFYPVRREPQVIISKEQDLSSSLAYRVVPRIRNPPFFFPQDLHPHRWMIKVLHYLGCCVRGVIINKKQFSPPVFGDRNLPE
jgi:hypothetical protein